MRIKEFADKYGIDRHTVDYWTNIGLLHPRLLENGYRDYGEKASDEIRMILIAVLLDRPESIECTVDMLNQLYPDQWRGIIDELNDNQDRLRNQFNVARVMANKLFRGEQ